jgi:hypothetical protein
MFRVYQYMKKANSIQLFTIISKILLRELQHIHTILFHIEELKELMQVLQTVIQDH